MVLSDSSYLLNICLPILLELNLAGIGPIGGDGSIQRSPMARISHSPPAAIACLMPSGWTCLDRRPRRISIRLRPAHCDKPRICHKLRDFATKFVRNPIIAAYPTESVLVLPIFSCITSLLLVCASSRPRSEPRSFAAETVAAAAPGPQALPFLAALATRAAALSSKARSMNSLSFSFCAHCRAFGPRSRSEGHSGSNRLNRGK